MNQQKSPKSKLPAIIKGIFLILLILGFTFSSEIKEYSDFITYKPGQEVLDIVDKTKLTKEGIYRFYLSKPSISHTSEVLDHCKNKEDSYKVTGCYADKRIYVYDSQNSELDGMKEVTAVHELLHAVWANMDKSYKNRISDLVTSEYSSLKDKTNIKERMKFYNDLGSEEFTNELHSIIGTEYIVENQELLKHYNRYFGYEAVKVLHSKYQSKIDENDKKAKELVGKLENLYKELDSDKTYYETSVNILSNDIAVFNRDANSGYMERYEYDIRRNALENRINNLERVRFEYNQKINEANQLKDELRLVDAWAKELNKSIDASLAPAPKVGK